jgi:acetylornithine/succinyldiaminopimelate/putrescine aminotransferase
LAYVQYVPRAGAERLANRSVAATFADTVFFANSGAEAWECAFKVVRSFNHVTGRADRHRVITCENAFHGRTMAAIAATDQEKLRAGFSPLPDPRNQGLLTAVAGQNVVRLLPPLIIEERHMDEACEKLRNTARLLA